MALPASPTRLIRHWPAQVRAAPPPRGHPRAGAEARARRAQRHRARPDDRRGGGGDLPVRLAGQLPRRLLPGDARAGHRATTSATSRSPTSEGGVAGRPPRRDVLRPAGPHRPRRPVRHRRSRATARRSSRPARARHLRRAHHVLPARPVGRVRDGDADGVAALQGLDRRRRARLRRAGQPAEQVRRGVRPGPRRRATC